MDNSRKWACEALGTFVLVFLGVGSISASHRATSEGDLLAIALAFGAAVAMVVAATGHISGAHINPAVTVSLMVTGKIKPPDAVAYCIAQLLGGVAGAAACDALLGSGAAFRGATLVTTSLITPMQGAAFEAVLTFILVFVIFGTAVDMRSQKLPALFIGLAVTVDILVGGPYTNASMNPARSFGPAVIGNIWTNHWVYWVGPLAGGIAAAVMYMAIFLPRTPVEARPEVRPDAAA